MLDKKNLLQLMKTVAKAERNAPTAYSFNGEQFSYSALDDTLRNELNEYMAGGYHAFEENKHIVYSIMEEVIDDVLPNKVREAYEMFAEVKQFAQGDKPMFRRKISARNRAKQFVTRVGLAGRYEVWKLAGSESFEVPTSAIGGGIQVGLEEYLDKRVDFAEMMDIMLEGMDELIFHEIGAALIDAINQLPAQNRAAVAGFDEQKFDNLISVVRGYGSPVIYCSYDFAVKMIPTKQWMYSDNMKEQLWNQGHFNNYKGTPVIIMPNGFVDETNEERTVDPGYCWIMPSGGDNKPVKIAFEGDTLVKDHENDDWSRDTMFYKKVGVVALMANNICSYIDTSLQGKKLTNQIVSSQYKYTIS